MLDESIEKALKTYSFHPELSEVMNYAVLPAGKLFRPRLVLAMSKDLGFEFHEDFLHLAVAVEIHHAYTLVHDDLPAMDNDLIRRGRASTHAKYGHWQAILTGDALLISSFREIAKIKDPLKLSRLLDLFTWATGAKGLIEGQYRDLEAQGRLNLKDTLRVHELKTSRLIQVALLGTYLLTLKNNLREKIDFLRLGREIGVSFQLLDDLNELTEVEVSSHEKSINPFITSPLEALGALDHSIQNLNKLIKKYRLVHIEEMLEDYFLKNKNDLLNSYEILKGNIEGDTEKIFEWITNFS